MNSAQSLIIGGMHRSHTSLMAEAIQGAGLFIGEDLIPPASSNARGHFESRAIVNFHEKQIDQHNLYSWWHFIDSNRARAYSLSSEFENEARALIDEHFEHPLFGWKDPRSAFFIEGWHKVLPHPHYIFCIRHPASCVQSLNRRSLAKAAIKFRPFLTTRHFNLWYGTNLAILEFVQKHPKRCFVIALPQDLQNENRVELLNIQIKDKWNLDLGEVNFADIYDRSLITSHQSSNYINMHFKGSKKIQKLYQRLLDIAETQSI